MTTTKKKNKESYSRIRKLTWGCRMIIQVPDELRKAIKTDKEREAIEAAFGLKQSYYEARGYSRAAATERAWCSLIQDLPNRFNWN